MARTRPPSGSRAPHSTAAADHGNGNGHAHAGHAKSGEGLLESQDWFNGSLSAPMKTMDFVLEMQRQWLKTASMGSETLALELEDLQRAKDPVQFVSTQCSLASHQLEILAQQAAAVMQQVYDAQLMWIGQWDAKEQEPQSSTLASGQGQSALGVLGKVQDEWLSMTRNWIESINTASGVK